MERESITVTINLKSYVVVHYAQIYVICVLVTYIVNGGYNKYKVIDHHETCAKYRLLFSLSTDIVSFSQLFI